MASDYDQFKLQRGQLEALLDQAAPLFQRLGLKTWEETLRQLKTRLASSTFKVLVLGEFKRGKSTFINALLGEEILPAFARPCTAVINEVKWGEKPRAVLYFRHPLPDPLPEKLAPAARQYIQRKRSGAVPPIEIPVDQLADYVVIPDPARDQAQSVAETPYERVELFWPLPLCQNGVEVIDSPGLNEHIVRTQVASEYLKTVDAVLFVMSCSALGSLSEMQFLDTQVRNIGHDYLFLICNRFDEVRTRERADFVAFAQEKLKDKTAFETKGIFFVSALDALDGRLEKDPARVNRSGMPELEKALADFLVHYRGKIKLLQPARNLKEAMREVVLRVIPDQRSMLHIDLEGLQQRFEVVRPKLQQAEKRREQLLQRVEVHRRALHDEVRRETLRFWQSLADQMPKWAEGLQVENTINAFKIWNMTGQVEKLSEEVVRGLQPLVEKAQAEWERQRLHPLVEKRLAALLQDIDVPLQEFLDKVQQIRADMSGLEGRPNVQAEKISALERVLAGAGGFVLGGFGSAAEGMTMGYQGMVRGLLPQVGVGLAVLVLFGWNPLILIPALLGTAVVRGLLHGDKLTDRHKLQVAQALTEQMIREAPERAEKVADGVFAQTQELADAIGAGLENQLRTVREEFAAVMQLKQAGEAEVQDRLRSLGSMEASFQEIDSGLTELLLTLAEPEKR